MDRNASAEASVITAHPTADNNALVAPRRLMARPVTSRMACPVSWHFLELPNHRTLLNVDRHAVAIPQIIKRRLAHRQGAESQRHQPVMHVAECLSKVYGIA